MPQLHQPHRATLLLFASAVFIGLTAFWSFSRKQPAISLPPEKPTAPNLSILAPPPDWESLEIFQNTITREEFATFLTTVFTTGDAWGNFIQISDTHATIQTGASSKETFTLRFSPASSTVVPRQWRSAAELPPTTPDQPLAGLKIAIDPGHIGGDWAKMEERWLVFGNGAPICEGDMTLLVARLLKPELEALGASVSLVRDDLEPITTIRPDDLLTLARETSPPNASSDTIRRTAERHFYRTAEIRARADLVNTTLKPDLVLCLHLNAESWGDPQNPNLIDRTHLHLILNGAYNDEEITFADQRFSLLQKLLQRTHPEEVLVGTTVAASFSEITKLPPYTYSPENKNALPVSGQPYLWVRNLIANRLYDCPVIFMEPYVMNSTLDFPRCQAGDYEGLREISGKLQPSIFREYADALTAGLKKHYTQTRKLIPSAE